MIAAGGPPPSIAHNHHRIDRSRYWRKEGLRQSLRYSEYSLHRISPVSVLATPSCVVLRAAQRVYVVIVNQKSQDERL